MGEGGGRLGRHGAGKLIFPARAATAAFAAALALHCSAQPPVDLAPKFQPPRPGQKASFIVPTPRQVESPCVAIDAATARVLISRKALDAFAAAKDVGRNWKTEDERMASIRGDRARSVLAAAKPATKIECAEVASELDLRGGAYLVFELLVSGNAAVIDAKGSRVTERFRIEYWSNAAGGSVSLYLDRGELFWHGDWFVT